MKSRQAAEHAFLLDSSASFPPAHDLALSILIRGYQYLLSRFWAPVADSTLVFRVRHSALERHGPVGGLWLRLGAYCAVTPGTLAGMIPFHKIVLLAAHRQGTRSS